MKSAIVVTSINDCTELLSGYLFNFAKYDHIVSVYVIPDVKTPPCDFQNFIICPTLQWQDDFLRGVGMDPDSIPRNSDNRRNCRVSDGSGRRRGGDRLHRR